MQMYVNYYDRKVKLEDENPTVGIIICKDKKVANRILLLTNAVVAEWQTR